MVVEQGEVTCTIASQSIRESGTQLTLRTFHKGEALTGSTVKYVRAPSKFKLVLM